MSIQRKIISNTLAHLGGKIGGTVLGLLTVALMTRYLGPEGYGKFTTVLSFLQMFAILAGFGLPITLAKLIAREGANERQLLANAFALRLVSGLAIFIIAPLVGWLFPYPAEIKLGIMVGALSFLGLTLHELLVAVFQKHLATWKIAIVEVAGRTVLLAGTAWAIFADRGLIAIVGALAAGNLLQFGLSFLLARRITPIGLAFEWSIWRDIFSESWPIGVAVIFNLIYLKGDIILLSTLRTQAEVGLYGAAYKVLDVVTVIPYIFMGLVLPLMSAAWSRGDREDFNRKFSLAFDALSLLALPLMFGAFAVSGDLITFVAGAEFTTAGSLLAVLMVGGFAVFWHALYSNALVAMGQQKRMVLFYALNAAISIGLYLWLIPKIGGLGAALVTAFSELFIAVTVTIIVTSITGFAPRLTQLGKVLAASLIMFGAVSAVSAQHVLWRILFGVLVYAGLLALIRGLPTKSLRTIFSRAH
ncbi:flippase [Patescibacteria group bacterium]|nr:flippase [Patescibacteria group bacterium]MBU1029443.1 flippase [Patescibacteria group bacterium]MBU1915756.1 flippase [Patescibacteria group bacterium]